MRVQRGDGERESGHDAREERAERDRQPDRVAGLRDLPQAQRHHQAEHHGEAHEVRPHDRERDELTREAHLADEVGVLEQRPRRGLRRRREEHPRREARRGGRASSRHSRLRRPARAPRTRADRRASGRAGAGATTRARGTSRGTWHGYRGERDSRTARDTELRRRKRTREQSRAAGRSTTLSRL